MSKKIFSESDTWTEWQRTVDPVEVEQPSNGGGMQTITTHPAFGMIGASRVTGDIHLAGSDFTHHSFISIKISPASLRRDLSHDWWFPESRSLVEVQLSEAQWAHFVSSLNAGEGAQCTFRSIDGKPVPQLPAPKSRIDQAKAEIRKAMENAFSDLDELAEQVRGMGLAKNKTEALLKQVERVKMQMTSNVPFRLQSFDEHMEKTVEKAKIEVNAYATNAIQRLGLEALAGASARPVLELGDGDDVEPKP